ncbi:DUF5723 family protein [Cesiribacter andamanensis]|nr:DUF5723 family protein [Cesiribacter andamanensis]
MKHLLIILLLLAAATAAPAQMYFKEGRQICCGDSLLAGYAQALDINPAQLGRVKAKKRSLGLLQIGSNVYSNRLDLGDALRFAFSDDSLSTALKSQLLAPGETEPFTFATNFDFNWASFSYATPQLGGIALRVRDRISSHSAVPNDLLALLLEGRMSDTYQNSTTQELVAASNGTRVSYSHIREASLGYGRALFRSKALSLYAGGTLKRLWGIGYYNTTIEGASIIGNSAFSEVYNINYGDLQPEGRNLDEFQRKILDTSGSGWGLDLGLTLEIANTVVLGAAVLDMGALDWNRGVVRAQASTASFIEQLDDPTIRTLNFKEQLARIYDEFSFEEGADFSAPLNTQMRLNASWLVGDRFSLSGDALIPLNNNNLEVMNYQAGTYAAGFNYVLSPGPVTTNLSSAFFYSSQYEVRVPLGLSLGFRGGAMFSIAVNDLLTFVSSSKDPFPGISITGLNLLF